MMTTRPSDDVLTLECQLRLIELCAANCAKSAPIGVDLYAEGFWAGVDAFQSPRETIDLAKAIDTHRSRLMGLQTPEMQAARAAGLIK